MRRGASGSDYTVFMCVCVCFFLFFCCWRKIWSISINPLSIANSCAHRYFGLSNRWKKNTTIIAAERGRRFTFSASVTAENFHRKYNVILRFHFAKRCTTTSTTVIVPLFSGDYAFCDCEAVELVCHLQIILFLLSLGAPWLLFVRIKLIDVFLMPFSLQQTHLHKHDDFD